MGTGFFRVLKSLEAQNKAKKFDKGAKILYNKQGKIFYEGDDLSALGFNFFGGSDEE